MWADGAVVFTKVSGGVHISNRTINWPMTGGVHLFAGRVMALSLVDNSARVVVGCTNTHTHTHACMQANSNPGLNHSRKHMVDTGRQLDQRGPLRLAPRPPPPASNNCFRRQFFYFLDPCALVSCSARLYKKNLSAWIAAAFIQCHSADIYLD